MSVLIPDIEVYNYVYNGLTRAAHRSVCDEWFSSRIRQHFQYKDIEAEARRLTKSWCYLNEQSYCSRYGEKSDSMPKFIRFGFAKKELQVHQLYMFVNCIAYNIEMETIAQPIEQQWKDDLKLLQDWGNDIVRAIVAQTPEYRNAKWSSV